MKTQILSRIQSQQNIPLSNALSLKRKYQKQTINLHSQGQDKLLKKSSYALLTQEDPYQSKRFTKQENKIPTKRKLFQSATTLEDDKKTQSNPKRKQMVDFNLNLKSIHKNRENKCFKMHKKFSGIKNQRYKSENSTSNLPNINTTHKNLLQKSNLNIIKTVTASAQKMSYYHQKSPEMKIQFQLKPMSHLMKTMTVLKDYKQSPYFAFTNKLETKTGQKSRPIRSLFHMSTDQLAEEKQEQKLNISIQLTQQKTQQKTHQKTHQKQTEINKQDKNKDFNFDCSQIRQKQIENDSSFLSSTNRAFLNQIYKADQKLKQKKKRWKKLPNDFLKY